MHSPSPVFLSFVTQPYDVQGAPVESGSFDLVFCDSSTPSLSFLSSRRRILKHRSDAIGLGESEHLRSSVKLRREMEEDTEVLARGLRRLAGALKR